VVPVVPTTDSTDNASPHSTASAPAAAAAVAAAEMPALLRLGNERSALLRSNARHLEVQLAEAEARCRDLAEVSTASTTIIL
jgi:7-keto-8-aminopelargonate synthetase-like enzyme